MPVIDAYATPSQYRDRVNRSDDGHDAEIAENLAAVSRYLDRKLRRFFTRDAVAVAHTFYPGTFWRGDAEAENPWKGTPRARWLDVDDIASTAGLTIKVDEARVGNFTAALTLAATDYQLYPLNADKGAEPVPWTRVLLPSWSSLMGWPPGSPVEITAVWGWPAVPQAVREATVQITGWWRLDTPRATSRIQEGLEGAIETSREAQRIIMDLTKNYAKVENLL